MKPELTELARQKLARCIWCDKELEHDKKYPVAFYHYLTLEETIATGLEEYGGGRFCSWDCMVKWIQYRAEKEERG